MLESRFVEFGPGRNVHAQIGGRGPAVVFFPGNGGSIADFLPVMQQLAEDHRVIGLDLPGRSETDWPDVRFDFTADLQPVIDWTLSQLGVGSHTAVGHGSGTRVALHHAQRHFGKIQGVSMVEGYVNQEAQQQTAGKRYRRPIRMSADRVEAFEQRRKGHAVWLNNHSTFRESFNATQRAYDASQWVGELEIPIQVIIGDQGQTLPPISDNAGWHKQLNLTKIEMLEISLIPDAGYWVMLDDPDKVSESLRNFIKCARHAHD
ncbi:MAG: alpha/beta hydrolase [Phycisphaeraceae bacterium]|nr:alpha/beta hydrolase [Phycisphaeraceae bacterium]